MQLNWFDDLVAPEKAEKAVGYLTYNVSVWTFSITVIVVLLTVVMLLFTVYEIRAPLKESADARKAEAESRRAEAEERSRDRSLDYLRLACGWNPKCNKTAGGDLQIAGIELLHEFPEYYPSYRSLLDLWKNEPNKYSFAPATVALQRLVDKTKPIWEENNM